MKRIFSWFLTHGAQRRPRVIWLAALPLTVSLLVVFMPVTSPAFAATNRHTASNLAAKTSVSSSKLIQLGQPSVTSTSVTTSQKSASNPCKTFTSYLSFGYLGVHNEMWLRMVTNFCYGNGKVTYHKTTLSWGVTSAGSASGWGTQANYYSFNCYIASGSAFQCSGNHEHDTERFINPFLRGEADLTIDQYEDRLGHTSNLFNAHFCPGGC